MGYITLSKSISQDDYDMLLDEIMIKRDDSKLREFCFWASKLCTIYPVERYGMYNPKIKLSAENKYEITWQCRDNRD